MPGQIGDQAGQLAVGQASAEPDHGLRRAVQEAGPDIGRGQAEQ